MATEKGLNLADLLGAPGLTSTLEQRLRAADTNGDGIISASEMIEVIQSEITATRDKKLMGRVLIVLGVASLLIIAAVVGLTYAVVEMSKDTGVENNVLVSKDGLQPLSTASLQKTTPLADLYNARRPSELDWLTHVTVPSGDGEAILRIQSVFLVPGERVRFDTAAADVSVLVTADGVTVSGDGKASNGRSLLGINGGSAGGGMPSWWNAYEQCVRDKCPRGDDGTRGMLMIICQEDCVRLAQDGYDNDDDNLMDSCWYDDYNDDCGNDYDYE